MNKNEKPSFLRGKGAAVGIVICFVAVIALVGAYTFNNYQRELDEQMAKAEEQAEKLTEDNMEDTADSTDKEGNSTEETTADDIVLPESDDLTGGEQDGTESLSGEDAGTQEDTTGDVSTSGSNTSGVWFTEDSTLVWPASGAVIMGYSMDQTVFFQTLEQYRYNPAMIIAGEVGETIGASAAGIVTNIEETAQTGTTVTLDMGNGYSAVYGQLTDVPVAVGDYVASGESLGTLGEPTKYYSVEGPNLYFEILKDGAPVDPMNFME
nr:M23 family metallopeptidase [uncultured Mediterraneibacter sp.]